MGGTKSLCQRIRSAKVSLDNAEQSFKAKQEVRGELDLMLAEAELKNLRQKRASKVVWTRQLLAACCAGLILLGGYGGWWWAVSSRAGSTGRAEATALTAARIDPGRSSLQVAEPGPTDTGQALKTEAVSEGEGSGMEAGSSAAPKVMTEAPSPQVQATARTEPKASEPVYIQPPVESRVQAYAKPETDTGPGAVSQSESASSLAVSTDEMRQLVRSGKQKLSGIK
jgi:hypothetical protein